ncbi:MAG: hypothetical protein ACE5IO_09260 [Thermoplasmata archaeon]
MRRKGPKKLVNLKDNVPFVHLNVGSGYISYIEVPSEESKPLVKGVLLRGKKRRLDAR